MKNSKNPKDELIDNIKNEEQHNKTKLEETTIDSLILEDIKNEQFEQYSEFEKRQEETLKKILDENGVPIEKLKGTPYYFTAKGFGTVEKDKVVVLLNAIIYPTNLKEYKKQNNKQIMLVLKAVTAPTGQELPPITVPLEQLENGSWLDNKEWVLHIVKEQNTMTGIINCIKYFARDLEKEYICQFIGCSEEEDKRIWVYPNNIIGTNKKIKVELGDKKLDVYKFTNAEFNIKEAFAKVKEIENIANRNKIIPMLALVFLAPLTTMLDEVEIPLEFLTWVQGADEKEDFSSIFASFFGDIDKNNMPLNLLEGTLSLKEKASKLKDVLVFCKNDFSSDRQENVEKRKFVKELISLISNGNKIPFDSFKNKPNEVNSLKAPVIIVGDVITDLTENDIKNILFINIAKEDIKIKGLKAMENYKEELQYILKKYIEYILNNDEAIKAKSKTIYEDIRAEAVKDVPYKTAVMIAELYVGYSTLLEFAENNEVITAEEKLELLNEAKSIMLQLGKEQRLITETTSPVEGAVKAIETLAANEIITTVDYESAKHMKREEINKAGFIGYYSEDVNWIYPELLYKAVKNFYQQQGTIFPWNKATLCRKLFEKKYLYTTAKQERPQVRRGNPITNKEESFIGIPKEKIDIPCRYLYRGTIITK